MIITSNFIGFTDKNNAGLDNALGGAQHFFF